MALSDFVCRHPRHMLTSSLASLLPLCHLFPQEEVKSKHIPSHEKQRIVDAFLALVTPVRFTAECHYLFFPFQATRTNKHIAQLLRLCQRHVAGEGHGHIAPTQIDFSKIRHGKLVTRPRPGPITGYRESVWRYCIATDNVRILYRQYGDLRAQTPKIIQTILRLPDRELLYCRPLVLQRTHTAIGLGDIVELSHPLTLTKEYLNQLSHVPWTARLAGRLNTHRITLAVENERFTIDYHNEPWPRLRSVTSQCKSGNIAHASFEYKQTNAGAYYISAAVSLRFSPTSHCHLKVRRLKNIRFKIRDTDFLIQIEPASILQDRFLTQKSFGKDIDKWPRSIRKHLLLLK